VKTKRQLNLEVPAGFRNGNTYQRQVCDYYLAKIDDLSSNTNEFGTLSEVMSSSDDLPITNTTLITTSDITDNVSSNPFTTSSVEVPAPILRCVDKSSSSLPSKIAYAEDFLRACVGFLLSLAPETTMHSPSLLPSWIKGGANATLFLENMSKP